MSAVLVQEMMLEQGNNIAVVLIKEYKNGNIIVYKETAIFKFVKAVPMKIMEYAASKVIMKGE